MKRRRNGRARMLAVIGAGALMLSACGGDDDDASDDAAGDADSSDDSDSGGDAGSDDGGDDGGDASDDAGSDDGGDAGDDGAGGSVGDGAGMATVTIDGVAHQFGEPEGVMTACTSIGGSLQVVMPEVDESGAAIANTQLSLYLLEADADRSLHSDPNIEVQLADATYNAGESAAMVLGDTAPTVDLEPDGRSASGSNPVVKDFDAATVVDVQIDVSC